MPDEHADVVVVGGGPAGATAAAFVAMCGLRVIVLEAARFPRYQVGESLMVSTVQGIACALGVRAEVDAAGFVRKPGGVFRWGDGDDLWTLSFTQARQLTSRDSNYALHVERAHFDRILLDHARRVGADVREGAKVQAPIVELDRLAGIVYRAADGTIRTVRARYVVDASGHASVLSSYAGRRVYSHFFRNLAFFAYYRDAGRLMPPLEGAGISEAFRDGWMWFLPLSRELTGVGAVVGSEHAELLQGDQDRLMHQFLSDCPHIGRLLSSATRIKVGQYGKYRVRRDFSYTTERFWRPGLALIGDAACFLDPLFTTGVHFATYAALLAARSIVAVIRDGLPETKCFDEFEHRYRLEFELFYNYVIAYYDMHVEPEGEFWATRKIERNGDLENPEFVHLLTQGAVSPEAYFAAKRGIGRAAQIYVDRIKHSADDDARAAISRAMAEDLHHGFQPAGFAPPFHLGFEDIRRMSWDPDQRTTARYVSRRGLVPSSDGRSWSTA
jgi:halogenation protein CepH